MSETNKLLKYLKDMAYEVGYGEGFGWDEYVDIVAEKVAEDPYEYVSEEYYRLSELIGWIKTQTMILLSPSDIEEIRRAYSRGVLDGETEAGEYRAQVTRPLSEVRRRLRRRLRQVLRP